MVDLAGSLGRLRYVESRGRPRGPGQFQRRTDGWEIVLRTSAEGARREPQRVRLETREAATAYLFETARIASPAAPSSWVHRNYLAR